MQDVEKKDPTCTESGWKAHKRCSHYCGKTEGYEEIPATGHNMSILIPRVEPTCENGEAKNTINVPTKDVLNIQIIEGYKPSGMTR